ATRSLPTPLSPSSLATPPTRAPLRRLPRPLPPFFFLPLPPPPTSTLFPYTTLFRSRSSLCSRRAHSYRVTETRVSAISAQARKRSEEHTSELQSLTNLVCRLLLEKKKKERNTEVRTLVTRLAEQCTLQRHETRTELC